VNQAELLRRAIDVLESEQIAYMLVGSFASMAYGEPRLTQDIDIVVDLAAEQLDAFCAAFPAEEYYVSRAAARQAVLRGGQFNVIHPTSGNKVDFMLVRRDDWGRAQLARRRRLTILPELNAYTASPEDVILGKLWYYREGGSEKHLRDIAAMLQVSGELIDKAYVADWARQLGLVDIWEAVLARLREQESSR
jgi:hypothetical protein